MATGFLHALPKSVASNPVAKVAATLMVYGVVGMVWGREWVRWRASQLSGLSPFGNEKNDVEEGLGSNEKVENPGGTKGSKSKGTKQERDKQRSFIDGTRLALNDLNLWDLPTIPRLYLFSEQDQVVHWADIPRHAVESAKLSPSPNPQPTKSDLTMESHASLASPEKKRP